MTVKSKQRKNRLLALTHALIEKQAENMVIYRRIYDGIKQSNTVLLSKNNYNELDPKIKKVLDKAPKIKKTRNSYIFDFEPEVEGTNYIWTDYTKTLHD